MNPQKAQLSVLHPEIRKYKVIIAITVLLIFISKCLLFYYYVQFKQISEVLISERQENFKIAKVLNQLKNQNSESLTTLVSLKMEKNAIVEEIGWDESDRAVATVYWDMEMQDVYLYVDTLNLSPPPIGKEYRLYAKSAENSIDIGVIDVRVSMQKLEKVEKGDFFVIKLEENKESESSNEESLLTTVL